MIDPRIVGDVVGSTVASFAQTCARHVTKRCQHVRTSRTVGEFVVTSGLAALKRQMAPTPASTTTNEGAVSTRATTSEPAAGSPQTAPIADYDLLTSAQAVEALETLPEATVRAVLDYEMGHRRRRLVVEAAQRLLTR